MIKVMPDILDRVDFVHSLLGDSAKLHESALASVGRVLTLGCADLTEEPLMAVMHLGQCIKGQLFTIRACQVLAFNLGVSLGESMGLTADEHIDLLASEPVEATGTYASAVDDIIEELRYRPETVDEDDNA